MSTIGQSLENVVTVAAKGIGKAQVGINLVLWGKGNTQPIQTVKYNPANGSLAYIVSQSRATPQKKGNLIESGLFNALDALNRVDLCNVVTYAVTNINIPKKPRPNKPWNRRQEIFFGIQDTASEIVSYIDKYTAYKNLLIGSYSGTGPAAISIAQAVAQSGAPQGTDSISGTNVSKYNMYNLMQNMSDIVYVLQPNSRSTSSLLSQEDLELLGAIPGLTSNLNIVNDFIGKINQYADYRAISSADLAKLENTLSKVRAVCVTIQTLDLGNALATVGNFLNTDIRKQIQELNKYIDVTRITKELKNINNAIKSFISIGNKVQGVLKTAQFIVKLLILFVKIFKFLIQFFIANPLPNIFTTSGVQSALDKARSEAEKQQDSITRLLKEINALLEIVSLFIRYILANANELLARLQPLLLNLVNCESFKNSANGNAYSEVLQELRNSTLDLEALKDNLASYLLAIDSRTNPETATFGKYSIKIVDDEVVDRSIRNKRRRGIALDIDGRIVVQSDLTFATNPAVIIGEVRLKLVKEGFIQPGLAMGSLSEGITAGGLDIAVITESLSYLDDADVDAGDLSLPTSELDNPDNEDEDQGLGLNAFINKLKGGKRLRRRTRAAMANQKRELAQSLAKEDPKGSLTAKTTQKLNKSAAGDEIVSLQASIGVKQEEITTLYAVSPIPNPGTLALITQKTKEIAAIRRRIKELQRQVG